MSSPRRPLGPPAGMGMHGHAGHHPAGPHARKQSSSSGSSPVGSTRSVVFEDQDPLLPGHKRGGTPRHHQSKPKPLANQRKF